MIIEGRNVPSAAIVSIAVINSRLPSCTKGGLFLPRTQITFTRTDFAICNPFSSILYRLSGWILCCLIIGPRTSKDCWSTLGSEEIIRCLWTCVLNLDARCGWWLRKRLIQCSPHCTVLSSGPSRSYKTFKPVSRTLSTLIRKPRRSISSICLTTERSSASPNVCSSSWALRLAFRPFNLPCNVV